MKTIYIEEGQTIVDIALQEYGNADAIEELCDDNEIGFDYVLSPGRTLLIRDKEAVPNQDEQIRLYFADRKIKIRAGIAASADESLLELSEGVNLALDDEGTNLIL